MKKMKEMEEQKAPEARMKGPSVINRRLGGGLAALVKAQVMAKHTVSQKVLETVGDDAYKASSPQKKEVILKAVIETAVEEEKKAGALSDDEGSYYDEEEDSEGAGSLEDFKTGKGFDVDEEIDLSDITEKEVQDRKLAVMHEKLEADYQRGFEADKDPSKLIELKNLRLIFLNIGPTIQSLEFFENLENLFLQQNCIERIG